MDISIYRLRKNKIWQYQQAMQDKNDKQMYAQSIEHRLQAIRI